MANEAFRFKTSGKVENGTVVDRYFIYSKGVGESGYNRIAGTYSLGEWYTIAFTLTPDNGSPRANTVDIYINGEKVISGTPLKKISPSIDKLIFQTGTKDLTTYWIDDFVIWSGDYTDR
ncbi:hypothetical protein [Spirochaeta thermophila]|uniref:hypothetical protein n=1 Tax=Winmispira thermophila TaxID=154 RepID=UPI0001F1509D|nr:hypothetical protein [Spirochaeta thermophila]